MFWVKLVEKRGDLLGAALVLPILALIVFFVFDMSEKQIVRNAAAKAAREAARIYAQQQDMSLAISKAQETYEASSKGFGTLQSINVTQTHDYLGSYAVATVQASFRRGVFDFVWGMMKDNPPTSVIEKKVYMIEITSGQRQF